MSFKRPSGEDETRGHDSLYGEPSHATESTRDERALYGEPRHEVESRRDDERVLYGEPQHETPEDPELPDVELLFARLRTESVPGPTVLTTREPSTARTTER